LPKTTDVFNGFELKLPEIEQSNIYDSGITIQQINYDPDTRKLTLKVDNHFRPGSIHQEFDYGVWLEPKNMQDDLANSDKPMSKGLLLRRFTPDKLSKNEIQVTLEPGISLSQHFIYVERRAKIFTNGDNGSTDDYVYSDLVDPAQGYRFTDSIVVTPYGLEIVRTSPNEGQTVGRLESVRTIKEDEAGNPLRFLGAHTNPVVFSHDGTLAFIAGKRGSGKIYVLDTQSLSIVHTIELRNRPENISAMIMHDSWLYIAETGKNGRLIRLMANPLENGYLETEQVIRSNHIAGLEHGIGDLALSDNRYLGMVAAREEVRVFNQFGHSQVAKGDVYILDLEKINSEGIMDSGVLHLDAGFFETHDRGRSPDQIIAGLQPGEFLVSYASDRNKGVSGIRAELASGSFDLTGKAKLVSTSLYPDNDKDRYMRLMRQNVQRASDMVLAVLDNMLYAFVSDYAFKFNDPSWTEESKFGAGRQIGGKIAVIRDPFGYHGQPQYIGSPSAIEGAELFVGVDSVPMHIAAALDKPQIALFGATWLGIWHPYSLNAEVIWAGDYTDLPHPDSINTNNPERLLKAIPLEEVWNRVSAKLEKIDQTGTHAAIE